MAAIFSHSLQPSGTVCCYSAVCTLLVIVVFVGQLRQHYRRLGCYWLAMFRLVRSMNTWLGPSYISTPVTINLAVYSKQVQSCSRFTKAFSFRHRCWLHSVIWITNLIKGTHQQKSGLRFFHSQKYVLLREANSAQFCAEHPFNIIWLVMHFAKECIVKCKLHLLNLLWIFYSFQRVVHFCVLA